MADATPVCIDGYELLEQVGAGRMGTVYRAMQTALEREVAVKVLHPRIAERADVIGRFQREAQSVAQLNHPHIVLGIDTGVSNGHHFFVMEFLAGGTLMDLLEREGAMDSETALHYLEQMASALSHAASKNLVHCDIKPDNMMLDEYGNLKLTDLGLARIAMDGSGDGVVRGTPHYLAPEQVRCDVALDSCSDLYSLGASFFHLVTGRTPFSGANAKEIALARLRKKAPDPRKLEPDLDEGLARLIRELMDPDRNGRPKSAEALGDRVAQLRRAAHGPKHAGKGKAKKKIAAEKPAAPAPRSAAESVRRFYRNKFNSRTHIILFILAILVALGLAALFGYFLASD